MKTISKIIVFLIFIFGSEKLLSQYSDSTISVYLRQNSERECYLDLVFENKSEDTVFLLSKFKNYYLEWATSPGIRINGYINHKLVGLTWGEQPIQYFIFSDGLSKIAPQSSIYFEFNLGQFFIKRKEGREFGIDFDINFIYYTLQKNGDKVKESGNINMKTNYIKFDCYYE
jgi:hypothetical protein